MNCGQKNDKYINETDCSPFPTALILKRIAN